MNNYAFSNKKHPQAYPLVCLYLKHYKLAAKYPQVENLL